MLVLTRYIGQKIIINENITVMITGIQGNQVRIAVDAPRRIPIYREEIQEKIKLSQELLETRL